MSNEQTYNGWTNRETWAAHLYITNDQGLYEYMREQESGEGIKDWFESQVTLMIENQCHRDTALMLTDIGSLWRVDWVEVYGALHDEGK